MKAIKVFLDQSNRDNALKLALLDNGFNCYPDGSFTYSHIPDDENAIEATAQRLIAKLHDPKTQEPRMIVTPYATVATLEDAGFSKEATEILNEVFLQDPVEDRTTVFDFTNTCTEYAPDFPSRRDYKIAKTDESFVKFELSNGNILVCS